ncbi:MAG: erythromycin esterase family protein [Cellulosilyticaceae bacterium]
MKGINKWSDGEWLFILIALGALAWWIYSSQNTNLETYFAQNAAVMSIDSNSWDDLALLEMDLKGKEIILTGESHGIGANMELEIKFLKYLKEKTPLKYYLCETSYSSAQYINEYLSTGEEAILEKLYQSMKGTYYYTEDSYKRWITLYEYNQTLELEDRIQVVGLDIEHQGDIATEYLKELLPTEVAPEAISEKIKLIGTADELSREVAEDLAQDLVANEASYKAYLGERYFDFAMVCNNITYAYEAYDENSHFNVVRDMRIYENFKAIYEILPHGVYYGQWGINHIFQKEQNNTKWFASYLEDKGFEDKILSIAYVYKDCQVMTKGAKDAYGKKHFTSLSDNYNLLKGLPANENLLLRLTGEDSPFDKKLIWPISYQSGGDTPTNGVTTDYFQYLVVIRGSDSTEPLNE